jgi:hypothetical protein
MKKEKEFYRDFKTEEIRERWLEVLKLSENDNIISEALKDVDFSGFQDVDELNSFIDYAYNDFVYDEEEKEKNKE